MKKTILCLTLAVVFCAGSANGQGISATLDESDPIVASTIVLTTAYFMQRWEAFCQRLHPATVPAIRSAHDDWMVRHEALYVKAGDIFTALLSTSERRQLMARWKEENAEIESRLAAATRQESLNWCT